MDPAERQSQSETLSSALRLIRAHRRMKSAEVAEAMGMALRSYEHFEAGGGRINLERIHRLRRLRIPTPTPSSRPSPWARPGSPCGAPTTS